jgi:hypothetical protein
MVDEMRHQYADALVKRWLELAAREEDAHEDVDGDDEDENENENESSDPTFLATWLASDPVAGKCSACDQELEESCWGDHRSRHELPEHWECSSTAPGARFIPSSTPETVTVANMGVWAERFEKYYMHYILLMNLGADEELQGKSSTVSSFVSTCLVPSLGADLALPRQCVALLQVILTQGGISLEISPNSALVYAKDQVWTWLDDEDVDSDVDSDAEDRVFPDEEDEISYSDGTEDGDDEMEACDQGADGSSEREEEGNAMGGDDNIRVMNWLERSSPERFLKLPATGLNPATFSRATPHVQQHGGVNSDVWTRTCTDLVPDLKYRLDEQAKKTNDRPIPRYQMIIDPNLFTRTRKLDGKTVWVPSEFDISPDGSRVGLVGGRRAHWIEPDLINAVATPVLQNALPLLARLRRPSLLLEGQRLQVVVKAQRIEVPEKKYDAHVSEYKGLWHVDGENEPIVAVVLFYYNVDDALIGGNMEFLDRQPMAALRDDGIARTHLRTRLRPTGPGGHAHGAIPNCSVPIETGTLLVFSNYQMVHRVLKMVNTSKKHAASRDFIALFILDPAARPLVPARCHLAQSHLYEMALTGELGQGDGDGASDQHVLLSRGPASLILEFLGIVPTSDYRCRRRIELLHSQLQPKGHLRGCSDRVYSTGNGCATMIGWIDGMLESAIDGRIAQNNFQESDLRLRALNVPPNQIGRGLSETLSIETFDLETVLDLTEYKYRDATA